MLSRSALSLLVLTLFPLVAACGGGGGGAPIASAAITVVAPANAFAREETAFRISGENLPSPASAIRVRLEAATGTPFHGGTSSTFDFEPGIADLHEIAGILPATGVTERVLARVRVISPSGIVDAGDTRRILIRPQRLDRIDEHLVSAGTLTNLVLHGEGFHPVGHVATVTFLPVSGPGFRGNSSLSMTASITSDRTVSVIFPDVRVLDEVRAAARITLPSGLQLVTPEDELLTVTPVPFLEGNASASVFALEQQTFVLQGFGFDRGVPGDEEDEEDAPTLRLTASSGTPFRGGTERSIDVTPGIRSNNVLEVVMPPMSLREAVSVSAVLQHPDGTSIASDGAVIQVQPQAITEVSPATWTHLSAGNVVTVRGFGLLPGSGEGRLRVSATKGTPFFGGTTAQLEIPVNLTNTGSATGLLPDLRIFEDAEATVDLVLPTGVTLAGGDLRVTLERAYANFDSKEPLVIGTEAATSVAAADFDGNGVLDLVFSHSSIEPYVYLNDGTARFPLELREELGGPAGDQVFALNLDFQVAPDIIMTSAGDDDGGPKPPPGPVPEEKPTADVSAEAAGPHRIYRNDGQAFFPFAGSFGPTSSGSTAEAKMLDLDADGRLDMVIAYTGDTRRGVELWRNTGFGSFQLLSRLTESLDVLPDDVVGVAGGDFNGDGRVDLALLSAEDGIQIWRQTSRNEFVRTATIAVNQGRTIEAVDIDGDFDLDLLVGTSANLLVYENRTPTTFAFALGQSILADLVNQILVRDMDGDGDLDLVIARGEEEAERSTVIYDNLGQRQFLDTGFATPASATRGIALADIDGDGLADLIQATAKGKVIFFRDR